MSKSAAEIAKDMMAKAPPVEAKAAAVSEPEPKAEVHEPEILSVRFKGDGVQHGAAAIKRAEIAHKNLNRATVGATHRIVQSINYAYAGGQVIGVEVVFDAADGGLIVVPFAQVDSLVKKVSKKKSQQIRRPLV